MRRTLVSMFVVLLVAIAAPAFADNGAPGDHGVDGRQFGELVADLARSEPGAVADHVSEGSNAGGAPAAHELSGADFGAAVAALAKSGPQAVANHVKPV